MSPELTADAVPIGGAATAELAPEVHDAFRGSSWGEHPVPGTLPDILHLIRRIEGGDDPADAVDQLTLLERIRHAAGAAQLRVMLGLEATRRAEQGTPEDRTPAGLAAEVGLATRASAGSASRRLGIARSLRHHLPRCGLLHAAGLIDEGTAAQVVTALAPLSRADRLRADRELAAELPGLTWAQAGKRARAIAYALDPQAAMRAAAKAAADRYVSTRPAPDCMVQLTALLPVKEGVAVHAALIRAADAPRGAEDQRTRAQVMADTLVELVTGRSTDTIDVEVGLIMTDRTLLDGDDDAATVPGYGPIPGPLARALVLGGQTSEGEQAQGCHAASVWLRRLYADPETGELASIDAKRRTFTGVVRRLVVWRDGTCRVPYCDAPIRHIDHAEPYAEGGPTSADNAVGMCEAHNYAMEAPGFARHLDPDGALTVITPTGGRHTSPPRRATG
ncbi:MULTISPECIES: DUF222 domain-containing protein [Arsenicicoccus]|uniref:13E12 repeat family protein n=1 Tax=Arsenicicoccus bolidensis TaxID=229480 RepID=A0ABS9Q112_9MICO|nr:MULTISPECIES: DUF222 domain-containing protein [Arsenicicoccus]MCG7321546.1 13E12 repeat family protein [Arsenicicoccus bolidensis]